MIIPDIGIKKLVEDGFLPPGLTIGHSSVDLTLSNSFNWPEPEKDKLILGESVPHKQVQKDEFVLELNHFVLASTAESIPCYPRHGGLCGGKFKYRTLGIAGTKFRFY